jgi:hypothetical protein
VRIIRHWFWHIVAMASIFDIFEPLVSDDDWQFYTEFMRSHGFDGCP